ncbi:MAG: 16S rRNA (guanine(966)-N(2))-methyltransferase RsmD [Actinomycetota bacterium]|nr:16S rRNA (guanine(966)-N(2))-methyltransferase RsmD [Actinomycetota bacterium]
MRVVAGVAGGRRLRAPEGRRIRPTSERVREAVFNALGSMEEIAGRSVLDLFAGTGALGIEALSRGAATATFVDADQGAVRAIEANLAATGLGERARVVHDDVQRFLGRPGAGQFDLAFADPPYAFSDWAALLDRVPARLIAIEARSHVDVGDGWRALRSRRYGDTVVTLARRPAGEPPVQTVGGEPPVQAEGG